MDIHLGLESLELEWMFVLSGVAWGYQRDISQTRNAWHHELHLPNLSEFQDECIILGSHIDEIYWTRI